MVVVVVVIIIIMKKVSKSLGCQFTSRFFSVFILCIYVYIYSHDSIPIPVLRNESRASYMLGMALPLSYDDSSYLVLEVIFSGFFIVHLFVCLEV